MRYAYFGLKDAILTTKKAKPETKKELEDWLYSKRQEERKHRYRTNGQKLYGKLLKIVRQKLFTNLKIWLRTKKVT